MSQMPERTYKKKPAGFSTVVEKSNYLPAFFSVMVIVLLTKSE